MRNKVINLCEYVIAFSLGGLLVYFILNNPFQNKVLAQSTSTGTYSGVVSCDKDVTIDESGISLSVGKVYDSVIMIKNLQNNNTYSTGSGFVYKKDDNFGYIVTNQHVIANASQITVVMSDDSEVSGTLLGSDEYFDLAVVKIPVANVKGVATISSSEKTNLGDTIFTVGAPLGYEYRGTVTRGSLSGKNRLVTVSVKTTGDYAMKVLQIDAAVNPGNSGGPLCNVNGEVIGVISLKFVNDNVEGMGFAIPIEDAMNYVSDLELGKEIERPLLGITMANLSDTYLLKQNGIEIPNGVTYGIAVLTVSNNSGAFNAKLQKGDIITNMDGISVKNAAYLKYILFKHSPGDVIPITYFRNGIEESTSITLTKSEN